MPQKILLLSLTVRATFGAFCCVLVLLGAGREASGINSFRALQIKVRLRIRPWSKPWELRSSPTTLGVLLGPDTWMFRAVKMIPLTMGSQAEGRALIPFCCTCWSDQLRQQIKICLLPWDLGRKRRRKGEGEFDESSGHNYVQDIPSVAQT